MIRPSVAAYNELGQKFTEDSETFVCSARGVGSQSAERVVKRVTKDNSLVHCAGSKILRSRHYGSLDAGHNRHIRNTGSIGTDAGDIGDRYWKSRRKSRRNGGIIICLQRIAKD